MLRFNRFTRARSCSLKRLHGHRGRAHAHVSSLTGLFGAACSRRGGGVKNAFVTTAASPLFLANGHQCIILYKRLMVAALNPDIRYRSAALEHGFTALGLACVCVRVWTFVYTQGQKSIAATAATAASVPWFASDLGKFVTSLCTCVCVRV